jgi:hypothetical protein
LAQNNDIRIRATPFLLSLAQNNDLSVVMDKSRLIMVDELGVTNGQSFSTIRLLRLLSVFWFIYDVNNFISIPTFLIDNGCLLLVNINSWFV